ncbi:hypothetical protein [Burkholderia vietnamiensis]|uniref:hypothetical protein n=1 Tax=Burkholderia vietnamiensis TaxID=60552 RepID=UPI00159071BB|nr:hypothetical protein [Burkholderia vietnamiensis]
MGLAESDIEHLMDSKHDRYYAVSNPHIVNGIMTTMHAMSMFRERDTPQGATGTTAITQFEVDRVGLD